MKWNFSRRNLLKGAGALAGAAAATNVGGGLVGSAFGQTVQKNALLLVFLRGGYNALFGSYNALFGNADVFAAGGTFGCTSTNVQAVGSGLVVDKATYGANIVPFAGANMATVGINHGLSSHDPARIADWTNGTRSYALMLAAAMGGPAAIKCAVVGASFPDGPRPAEGNVSMQQITDMNAALNLLGANTDPTLPARPTAAAALGASKSQSQGMLAANPVSLVSAANAYDSAIAALQGGSQTFNFAAAQTAYGVTGTAVTSFTQQMLAAELMVRAGSNVICAISNAGWDTHGDTTGSVVRTKMNGTILPGLKVFTQRMMADPAYNVTVAVFGDFSRSLPGSDHARNISTSVWGKKVKQGVSAKTTASVGMATTNAAGQAYSIPGWWSFLASVCKSPTNPFGVNPHSALVLP
jgi:hypothetical protein